MLLVPKRRQGPLPLHFHQLKDLSCALRTLVIRLNLLTGPVAGTDGGEKVMKGTALPCIERAGESTDKTPMKQRYSRYSEMVQKRRGTKWPLKGQRGRESDSESTRNVVT